MPVGVAITGGNQHWQSQPHHWDLRQRDNQISFSFEIKAFNRLDPDYQVQPDFILDILTHKAYLTGQGALSTDLRSWLGPSQGHLQCQTPRQPPRPPSLNTFEFSKVISWETHKFEHKPCVRMSQQILLNIFYYRNMNKHAILSLTLLFKLI